MKTLSLIFLGVVFSYSFTSCSFKKEYITQDVLTFIDELWSENGVYNKVKFNVKTEMFLGKWIVISGKVKNIDDDNSVEIEIKSKSFWRNDFSSVSMHFEFDNPELIMNLKKGQNIKIEGEIRKVADFDLNKIDCDFYMKNSKIIK